MKSKKLLIALAAVTVASAAHAANTAPTVVYDGSQKYIVTAAPVTSPCRTKGCPPTTQIIQVMPSGAPIVQQPQVVYDQPVVQPVAYQQPPQVVYQEPQEIQMMPAPVVYQDQPVVYQQPQPAYYAPAAAQPVAMAPVYQGQDSGQFYIGAHFALNLANFSDKQHLKSNPGYAVNDTYSFVLMPGFDLAAGYQFSPSWRAELNYGYNGRFNDTDSLVNFSISTQYLPINALYTLAQWGATSAYAGAGLGGAMINSRFSGPAFVIDNNDSATAMTFAVQGMVGLEYALTDSFSVGAQYRLMYNGGATHERGVIGGDTYVAKISGMLTNSLMLGARYKF